MSHRMSRRAKPLLALAVCLVLLLSGCRKPAVETPPAEIYTFVDVLAEAAGGETPTFWWMSGINNLDLSLHLDGVEETGWERVQFQDFAVSGGEKSGALAGILAGIALDPDSRREEDHRPTEGSAPALFLSYNTPTDENNRSVYLLFGEDGRLYFCEDGSATSPGYSYAVLGGRTAADDLLAELWQEAGLLRYRVEFFLRISELIHPDSQVVKFGTVTNTDREVVVTAMTVRAADSSGSPVTIPAYDGLVLPVRDYQFLQIPLDALPGATSGDAFQVELTLGWREGDPQDTATLAVSFTLSEDGEFAYPSPDPMTPVNRAYHDKYLAPYGATMLYDREFSEDDYFDDVNSYFLFFASCLIDYPDDPYAPGTDGWYPADLVEELITSHFLVSVNTIRMNTSLYDPSVTSLQEAYDPATHRYYFPGGYGGAYPFGQVDAVRQSGDLLELDCSWYNGTDESLYGRHTLTIRLLEDGGFLYVSSAARA